MNQSFSSNTGFLVDLYYSIGWDDIKYPNKDVNTLMEYNKNSIKKIIVE